MRHKLWRASLLIFSAIFITRLTWAYESSDGKYRREEDLLLLGDDFAITPTRHARKVAVAPSMVTVITAEEIKNMGARNLMDVLQTVPGIGIYISRYGQGEIAVRGIRTSSTEKVRVMIDGHNLAEFFMASAMTMHDDLELDNVKQVEVIRGPGSALYGENAFVAVINVITKDAKDVDGTIFKAARGNFDTSRYNVTFGKQVEKLEVVGALTTFETDGPRLKVESDTFGNSGYTRLWKDKEDLNLKLSYNDLAKGGDRLTLNTKYTQRERSDYTGLIGVLNDESRMDLYQFFGELKYQIPVNEDLDFTGKIYYDHFHEDILFELVPSFYLAPLMTNRAFGVEGQVDYKLSPDNLLTVGAMLEYRKQYDVDLFVGTSVSDLQYDHKWNKEGFRRDIWAVYVQDEWSLPHEVNLTLGARYDHYSDFAGEFRNRGPISPRAGIAWQFAPNATLKILHGWAFRVPNSREMFDQSSNSTLGDPELKPETIKTTEAGINYRPIPGIDIGINYFYNRIRNLITETRQGSISVFTQNTGADVEGVEAELKASLWKGSYFWSNYSYQRGEFTDTHAELPDVPKHKLVAGINTDLGDYLSANTYVLAESKFQRAVGDTRSDVPGYATLNLTLIARKFFQTFEIRGSVYNLLDKEYAFSGEGWQPNAAVYPDSPQPGRQYLVEVSYKF